MTENVTFQHVESKALVFHQPQEPSTPTVESLQKTNIHPLLKF